MRKIIMFKVGRFLSFFVVIVILFLTLNTSCTSHHKYDRSGFDPEKICAGTENSFDCARAIEKALIEIYPDLVSRDNSVLYLKLKNGQTVTLPDSTSKNEESVRYFSLIDYLEKEKLYVVEEQWWEGGTYQLIDRRSGVMTEVIGPPVFSPKRDFFVTQFGDMESGYASNGLEIWTLTKDDKLLKVYELYPDDWAPDSIRWISDKSLEVKRYVYSEEDDSYNPASPIIIHREGARWTAETPTDIVPKQGKKPKQQRVINDY
jgi:hypothetical protein